MSNFQPAEVYVKNIPVTGFFSVKIPIQKAYPGMILSANVLGPCGNVLVTGKKVITQNLLNHLIENSVLSVEVIEPLSPNNSRNNDADSGNTKTKSLPFISISIDDNLMSACLIIEPSVPENDNLELEDLLSHFKAQHITTGIDEHSLLAVIQKWNTHKHRYEVPDIARGFYSQPGREGNWDILVRHISNKTDMDKVKNAHYMWELPELFSQVQRVVANTVIAERQISIPSIPGKNVQGDLVFTNETFTTQCSLGEGVQLSSDGQKVISQIEGIVCFTHDYIDVVRINFDGAVEIKISKDAMTAELVIHPAFEGGTMPSEQQIRDQLTNEKVTHGIDDHKLTELAALFAKTIIPDSSVIIATGTKPKNGQNGTLIFHFNTETSLKPKENSDGSVDYKSVNIVNSIAKKEKLVTLSAPTTGVPGTNIFGEIIACQIGSPASLPIGPNTEPDPENPDTLIASIDGIVCYNGSVVEISEGFIINGNVDFSTGNVTYKRSVIVKGDVKSGFGISCGGDIQVGGTIEDCMLAVGGNVLCRFGFSGQGKGSIDAKGNVNLGFMKNQTVRSRQNVNVAREAINSTIFARKVIQIHGNPLSAAGGCLTARDAIIINTVGNHSGIRTLLEVGFDFTLSEDLKVIEEHIEELTANQNKIIANLNKIEKTASMVKRLSLKDQILKAKLVESLNKYKQQLQAMEFRKITIEKKMYDLSNAMIKIERTAFPGTLIKFGERHYLVKEEIRGPKTVRLIDHEIKIF